ncbi:hypothetical protein ACFXKA_43220, partial [Nocardia sp. NPDC059228]
MQPPPDICDEDDEGHMRPIGGAFLSTLGGMYGYDQNPGAQQQYAPPQQPMGGGGYGEQPL